MRIGIVEIVRDHATRAHIYCTQQPKGHWNSLSDKRTRAQAKYNPRSRMFLYDIKIKTSFFVFFFFV